VPANPDTGRVAAGRIVGKRRQAVESCIIAHICAMLERPLAAN
jgi:hypothetical protein